MKKLFWLLPILVLALLAVGCGDDSTSQEAAQVSSDNLNEIAAEAEEKVDKEVPENLIQCDPEIFENMTSCSDLPDDNVCGYDHTVYEDGSEEDHGVDYRTPCHYCNFFGEDGVKDMMGTKVEALGYIEGECK